MSKSKTTTRFFTLTGSELGCETRCGNYMISCRIELKNGSFVIDSCSMNLLDAKKELEIYLDLCDRLCSDFLPAK